jgi:ABC-type amino acid transport substrate-binding protein
MTLPQSRRFGEFFEMASGSPERWLEQAALALALAWVTAGTAAEPAPPSRHLHACETEEGYPPFTFRDPAGVVRGYSVDLLNEALEGTGLVLDIAFLPPRRCTASVDSGVMDLSMEDAWYPDLADRWLPTDAIWEATEVLFYDRTRYADGLTVPTVLAQPDRYRGCGLLGVDYDGFAPGQVDNRSYQYKDAFARLFAGRCAFVADYLEFGAVFPLRGRALLDDPRIDWVLFPMAERPAVPHKYPFGDRDPVFLYLRRDLPEAERLIDRIDDTIARWRRTGRHREVMARYLDLAILPPAK